MAQQLRDRSNPRLVPLLKTRRVADLIVDTLGELGVDTFYGIPGGAISPIYDALHGTDRLLINTRHETGAVFMAAGHSRVGGSLPCVLMTSGPGITNALTGLASAYADGIPLLAIGGEVARNNFGRGALQEGTKYELDIIGMVRSVTKYSHAVVNPRAAANVVRRAVATARSGRRGPVFLSLPLDVACEQVLPSSMSSHVSTGFDVDTSMLAQTAAVLDEPNVVSSSLAQGAATHPMS